MPRRVAAPQCEARFPSGDPHGMDAGPCRGILAKWGPEPTPFAAAESATREVALTADVPIGALGVPIRLGDGTSYGMFCCGLGPHPSMDDRDRQILEAFAEFAAYEIDRESEVLRAAADTLGEIEAVLARAGPRIVYQPICDVAAPNKVVGYEALSRFDGDARRGPDVWFAQADEVDRRIDLELAAITRALRVLDTLPCDLFLTLNAAPGTAVSPRLARCLAAAPVERIMLEITEQVRVDDYDALIANLAPLRRAGLRVAIDDAGAGYSGLKHMLTLQPDFLKLDASVTRDIHADTVRQALVAALVGFAREIGSTVVAEGIESAVELATLARLGVGLAQGYHLGRPAPLHHARARNALRPALSGPAAGVGATSSMSAALYNLL